VKTRRLVTIGKGIFSGEGFRDGRGGKRERPDFVRKHAAVMDFIKKLRVNESHYNRAKTKRLYLDSKLSVAKLHRMYNEQTSSDLEVKRECVMENFFYNTGKNEDIDARNTIFQVSYLYFYKVFTEKFNIAFGHPATDTCSMCARLKFQMRRARKQKNEALAKKLITELKFHKAKAKGFYTAMKREEEGTVSYCFDLQQV
jgi:hypothetical protein